MRVNRPLAALLGLLTAAPLGFLVVVVTYWMPRLNTFGQPGGITEANYFALFDLVFRLTGVMALLSLGLLAFYAVWAHRAPTVPRAERTRWVAFLVYGNLVLMPVFWYLHVWRRAPAAEADTP